MKHFTELMRQVEMPNDILKLLEGRIYIVLLGRETFRGRRWHATDNISQRDEIITALMKNTSFKEGA